MNYAELEETQRNWNEGCCIFGAGLIGTTWGYEIIKAAGFCVSFYCDNGKNPGTMVRDGIKIKPLSELYHQKEKLYVFLCLSEKYQTEVQRQLDEHGVGRVCIMDDMFLQEFCRSIELTGNRDLYHKYACVMDDEKYLEQLYEARMGYKPDLRSPRTFNEKIQWLKIHDHNPRYSKLVDKYEAKGMVAEMIGEEYIIPTLGVWDSYDDIDFDTLPEQFVLKCTHDSGGIIICKDKTMLNHDENRKKFSQWLSRNYYWTSREWPYKDVKPRIIAENYLQDGRNYVPEDYKIYCFNGTPAYIVVFHNRFNSSRKLSETVYDTNWNAQKFSLDNHFEISEQREERPKRLKELLNVCKKLCKGFPQVRVDFYIIKQKIYFGEITFSTASGLQPMIPEKMDRVLGNKVSI